MFIKTTIAQRTKPSFSPHPARASALAGVERAPTASQLEVTNPGLLYSAGAVQANLQGPMPGLAERTLASIRLPTVENGIGDGGLEGSTELA